ncbi:MAG: RdgB/HAM1 family non-canonical purine NTP pyrophosphatase [Pyrinomonadaceae bacterium]
MSNKILLATNNPGKIAELRSMIVDLRMEICGLADFPGVGEVEETGGTFAENARLKAIGYARQTGVTALADDSGLEVDALEGRPGVLSARYGGEGTSFENKMKMLLGELENADSSHRSAQFSCAIAISDENGRILFESEGICRGRIALSPIGSCGFGYDPIFVPDGYEQTFGELSGAIKQNISHRSRAFSQIIPFLRDFIAV